MDRQVAVHLVAEYARHAGIWVGVVIAVELKFEVRRGRTEARAAIRRGPGRIARRGWWGALGYVYAAGTMNEWHADVEGAWKRLTRERGLRRIFIEKVGKRVLAARPQEHGASSG